MDLKAAFFSKWIVPSMLIIGVHLQAQQASWEEGAFHKTTNTPISKDVFMSQVEGPFSLFAKHTPLEITIESDFRQLSRDRNKDQYQEALLHYSLNDSITVKRIIRIKPRGEFRRKFCSKPPLKLNFDKTKFHRKELETLSKMKMVYACQRSGEGEAYVLKEYLAYRIYNILSDYSFAIRLIKLRNIDTGRKTPKPYDGFAFVIEEVDKLATRKNLIPAKVKTGTQSEIDPLLMFKVALFQYMIGNTDWSVTGPHNIKLFTPKGSVTQKPFAIPYDFDYSGIVNASYALPADKIDIQSVRDRYYLGACYNDAQISEVFKEFISKKEKIYSLINSFQYIKERTRSEMISYLDEFYQQISRKEAINYFKTRCGVNP